jgi:hypothetical protein
MRVITQNVSQRATDTNGFSANANVAKDATVVLDGVLASSLAWNGVAVIDLSAGMSQLVGFTLGATGSVANATIVGRDMFGHDLTEVVLLPGASDVVSSVEPFSYIESITLDAAATNLSVGILAANIQYAPWVPWDVNAGDFSATISVDLVSGSANYTLYHTIQGDMLINGPEPDNSFADTAMAAETADNVVSLTQPITASRIAINSGTAAVLKIKYLQAGGGYR